MIAGNAAWQGDVHAHVGCADGRGLLGIADFEDVSGVWQVEALAGERGLQIVDVQHAIAMLFDGGCEVAPPWA